MCLLAAESVTSTEPRELSIKKKKKKRNWSITDGSCRTTDYNQYVKNQSSAIFTIMLSDISVTKTAECFSKATNICRGKMNKDFDHCSDKGNKCNKLFRSLYQTKALWDLLFQSSLSSLVFSLKDKLSKNATSSIANITIHMTIRAGVR